MYADYLKTLIEICFDSFSIIFVPRKRKELWSSDVQNREQLNAFFSKTSPCNCGAGSSSQGILSSGAKCIGAGVYYYVNRERYSKHKPRLCLLYGPFFSLWRTFHCIKDLTTSPLLVSWWRFKPNLKIELWHFFDSPRCSMLQSCTSTKWITPVPLQLRRWENKVWDSQKYEWEHKWHIFVDLEA